MDEMDTKSPDVVRLISIELTEEQKAQVTSVGVLPYKRIHIDELRGSAARIIHPSLVSARILVPSW